MVGKAVYVLVPRIIYSTSNNVVGDAVHPPSIEPIHDNVKGLGRRSIGIVGSSMK
jgi:hypothetical protein